ncbi:hypothetical protein RND71_025272 [Anisodus tanguticus]|uniref:DUF1985 domain-containing protein n=1 Tax=Anisodus tanguticus TaxID=243964 RepID=A0AAE1RSM4_9SOLA|nr:hypothetical protein RND71_025272 [Anisodus tanguticus]
MAPSKRKGDKSNEKSRESKQPKGQTSLYELVEQAILESTNVDASNSQNEPQSSNIEEGSEFKEICEVKVSGDGHDEHPEDGQESGHKTEENDEEDKEDEEDVETEKDNEEDEDEEEEENTDESIDKYGVRTPLDDHSDLTGDIVIKSGMEKSFDNFRGTLKEFELENFYRARCFGYFLVLPEGTVARFQMKVVYELLKSNILCTSKDEVWINFCGMPVCFGMKEFAIVTGLRCYPPPEPLPTITLKKPAGTAKPIPTKKARVQKVVHPRLVSTVGELEMTFLTSFVPLESEPDILIDQFKLELAGVKTITRESSGSNGVDGAAGVDGAGVADVVGAGVGGVHDVVAACVRIMAQATEVEWVV